MGKTKSASEQIQTTHTNKTQNHLIKTRGKKLHTINSRNHANTDSRALNSHLRALQFATKTKGTARQLESDRNQLKHMYGILPDLVSFSEQSIYSWHVLSSLWENVQPKFFSFLQAHWNPKASIFEFDSNVSEITLESSSIKSPHIHCLAHLAVGHWVT